MTAADLKAVPPLAPLTPSGASDMAHIVLTFDNNKLASALYGQFDENLARIEQKLGVDSRTQAVILLSKIGGDPLQAAS